MPKSLYNRGLMRPDEIAVLQRVFDQACAQRNVHPETEEAREIALTILALHNAGMNDETSLVDAVGFPKPMARSA